MIQTNKQICPDPSLSADVKALALCRGTKKAAEMLGFSVTALTTLAAGLPGHRSMHRLASDRLAELGPIPAVME